jgi:hypothetical protein
MLPGSLSIVANDIENKTANKALKSPEEGNKINC